MWERNKKEKREREGRGKKERGKKEREEKGSGRIELVMEMEVQEKKGSEIEVGMD